MKFSSKEDIEAPIDAVFEMVSDFEKFERGARKRGLKVRRTDGMESVATGMTWNAVFDFRGRNREIDLTLSRLDPPTHLSVAGRSQGVTSVFDLELLALSRQRTRLAVELEMKPQTIAARVLIQSLRLAKARLTKRFKLRVAEYARHLEERHKRGS